VVVVVVPKYWPWSNATQSRRRCLCPFSASCRVEVLARRLSPSALVAVPSLPRAAAAAAVRRRPRLRLRSRVPASSAARRLRPLEDCAGAGGATLTEASASFRSRRAERPPSSASLRSAARPAPPASVRLRRGGASATGSGGSLSWASPLRPERLSLRGGVSDRPAEAGCSGALEAACLLLLPRDASFSLCRRSSRRTAAGGGATSSCTASSSSSSSSTSSTSNSSSSSSSNSSSSASSSKSSSSSGNTSTSLGGGGSRTLRWLLRGPGGAASMAFLAVGTSLCRFPAAAIAAAAFPRSDSPQRAPLAGARGGGARVLARFCRGGSGTSSSSSPSSSSSSISSTTSSRRPRLLRGTFSSAATGALRCWPPPADRRRGLSAATILASGGAAALRSKRSKRSAARSARAAARSIRSASCSAQDAALARGPAARRAALVAPRSSRFRLLPPRSSGATAANRERWVSLGAAEVRARPEDTATASTGESL